VSFFFKGENMKVNIEENLKFNDGSRKYPVKCKKCGVRFNGENRQNKICNPCKK